MYSYFLERSVVKMWFMLIILATASSLYADGMTAEMVADLQTVRQAAVSPNGDHIAYTVSIPRTADEAPGASRSELWVMPAAGGAATQYTVVPMSVGGIRWSPDGKHISFLSLIKDRSETAQVYSIPLKGGAIQQLSNHNASISNHLWSPDGRSIAFLAKEVLSDALKAAEAAGQDWIDTDATELQQRAYILDVASGNIRPLNDMPGSIWALAWSPDSKSLAIQASKSVSVDDNYMFSAIYKVSVADGKQMPLCKTEGKLGAMAFSPDGSTFAYLGAVDISDPLAQSLFVVAAGGGSAKNLMVDAKMSATAIRWLDNKTILMQASKGTNNILTRVDVRSGKMKEIYGGPVLIHSFSANVKKNIFAAVTSSATHPPELYSGSLKSGKMKRLTQLNPEMADVALGRQTVFSWKGADDWDMQGILTYPVGYKEGQRYPLALQIHGGPEGVSLNGWRTSATYPVQVLAANSYFVLEPNYRGSAGRGVAFTKADHDDLGGKEFEDVLAGIDALVEQGLVDNSRVVTGGWSYGGYFSAWAATRHSERFKASVVSAGLTNWIAFSGTTDIPHEMALVHWNSYWYDQPELHWQRSPLAHLENAKTPTMLVHGLKDDRVHPEQSMQLYGALKLKNVPTRMITYPREPHGLLERAHKIHFTNAMLNWFNKHIGSGKAQPNNVIN